MQKEQPSTDGGEQWQRKEVPRNLFHFEEKIWGMTLSQLLSDLFSGIGLFLLTAGLPLVPRLCVGVVGMLFVVMLVHGRLHGQGLLTLMLLFLRYRGLPRLTRWQAASPPPAHRKQPPSIQERWIICDTLRSGIAGTREQGRFWAVLEIAGRNVAALSEVEQQRIYTLFETVLAGLSFRLQWLTLVEQEQEKTSVPLSRYHAAAIHALDTLPHLQQLATASIQFQARALKGSQRLSHFVVVQVDRAEEAARLSPVSSGPVSTLLSGLGRLLGSPARDAAHTGEQALLGILGSRLALLKKRLKPLDIQARLLSDQAVLQLWVRTLAPGHQVPSFLPEKDEARSRTMGKQMAGLHPGSLVSVPATTNTLIREWTSEELADLLSPSQITLAPGIITIQVGSRIRYLRYLWVGGYGHHRQAGWMHELTDLGVPMILSTTLDPLERAYLHHRLEMQLVRLESQKLADQKTGTIADAARDLEAEQIRRLNRALAQERLQVCSTQLVIGLHAGSLERLEQRTRYVLTHLRQSQLEAECASLRQDQAWQSTWPTCSMSTPALSTLLGSDVLSTFLHADSGSIGTKTGAFLGWTGEERSKRSVYLNPWSEDKTNPHIVIVGDTGQGKSYTGKVLVVGLLALGLADVVVYDKDDDYLPMHQALRGESQRYDLARGCPINLFDLPFSALDCSDPDDTSDLLAEYIDNHLMTGLSLLVCEPGHRLTKGEEASLMLSARATYAGRGVTSESIRRDPEIVLSGPMPTLSDFLSTMRSLPACDKTLLERLERASYLFAGQTRISLSTPLTVFSIRELDEKYYALMSFVVQTFLRRHRAQHHHSRYLLKHPAGRAYLESGSRGFRKLGIAQITLSQHPREFLEEGAVILSNAGTAFFLGMQREAAERLRLPSHLERTLIEAVPGQAVMRNGSEYAAISIAAPIAWQRLLTTNPRERLMTYAPRS